MLKFVNVVNKTYHLRVKRNRKLSQNKLISLPASCIVCSVFCTDILGTISNSGRWLLISILASILFAWDFFFSFRPFAGKKKKVRSLTIYWTCLTTALKAGICSLYFLHATFMLGLLFKSEKACQLLEWDFFNRELLREDL